MVLIDEFKAVEDVERSTNPPAVTCVWIFVDPSLESCHLSLSLLMFIVNPSIHPSIHLEEEEEEERQTSQKMS